MTDTTRPPTNARRFSDLTLPHLDSAYRLARWLTRSGQDAEDVVQEAYLRAFRAFGGFRGDSARPWLLAIVRNASYDWLRTHRRAEAEVAYDDELHGGDAQDEGGGHGALGADPETILLRHEDLRQVDAALALLPAGYREVIVLRDIEELSYREIAEVAGLPMGTVMSRLARGRMQLHEHLARWREGDGHGM